MRLWPFCRCRYRLWRGAALEPMHRGFVPAPLARQATRTPGLHCPGFLWPLAGGVEKTLLLHLQAVRAKRGTKALPVLLHCTALLCRAGTRTLQKSTLSGWGRHCSAAADGGTDRHHRRRGHWATAPQSPERFAHKACGLVPLLALSAAIPWAHWRAMEGAWTACMALCHCKAAVRDLWHCRAGHGLHAWPCAIARAGCHFPTHSGTDPGAFATLRTCDCAVRCTAACKKSRSARGRAGFRSMLGACIAAARQAAAAKAFFRPWSRCWPFTAPQWRVAAQGRFYCAYLRLASSTHLSLASPDMLSQRSLAAL